MTQGVFHTRSCYYAGRVPPHFLPDRRPPSILQSGGMNLTRRGDGKSGPHRTLTGLVICLVCLTILGCGGGPQSINSRAGEPTEEEVAAAAGLVRDGIPWRAEDGCEVSVILLGDGTVQLYADAGSTLITNAAGTIAFKYGEPQCEATLTEAMSKVP